MGKDSSVRFWNVFAKRYARQPIADEEAYQKKLEITQGYFNRDMEVLEFGCGTGSTALTHAPHVKQYHAIDYSPAMIEIARQKLVEAPIGNLMFECSSIDELKVPEQSFDAVLGLSIMHLLPNWREVNEKVFDLLKPGGLFITSTVYMGNTRHWMRYLLAGGGALGLIPKVQFIDLDDYLWSLDQLGFEVEHKWQREDSKVLFLIVRKLA